MKKRRQKRPRPPTIKAIAAAHCREPAECWACGYGMRGRCNLTRAHVVAFSAGGSNDPSNFMLLCTQCHDEQPDGVAPSDQWVWLAERESWLERFVRDWHPMVAKLVSISEPDAMIYGEHMLQRLPAIIDGLHSASTSRKNWGANLRWAVLEDFRKWRRGELPL